MSTLITADNGTVSGSAGLKQSADSSGILAFATGSGTTAVTIDASQNVGLGVTPSAWSTSNSVRAIQVGSSGIGSFWTYINYAAFVGCGYYWNGTNRIYLTTGNPVSEYSQNSGIHTWNIAPSGTAGNAITFTQAMTLDASGKLGIGVTSPSQYLNVSGADGSNNVASFTRSGGATMYTYVDTGNNVGFFTGSNASGGGFYANAGDSSARIMAGGVERMRIDTSGNLNIKTSNAGIIFNNSSALTNSTLNDYETGTWTPTLGGSATYTVQTGKYTKIGNLVYITLRITVSSIGSGSTTTISGLPFSSISTLEQGLSISYFASLATSISFLTPRVISNSSTITFTGLTIASSSESVITVFQNSTDIIISGSYQATF